MSDQTLFGFARMTPAEYRDDCAQMRLGFDGWQGGTAELPKDKGMIVIGRILNKIPDRSAMNASKTKLDSNLVSRKDKREELGITPWVGNASAIRVVPCPSCGGSTFDDGNRPILCHCGATIPGEVKA